MKYKKSDVIDANIEYHTLLSESYGCKQPHFCKENINRVRNKLLNFMNRSGNKSLIDIGCGSGFIIDIAKNIFNKVVGIDITQAMLDKIDLSSNNIKLYNSNADSIPFIGESFNVCTAYAFLHHLYKLEPVFREIFRVLKYGGTFYSDEDPNYYFWEYLKQFKRNYSYASFVRREIDSVFCAAEKIKEVSEVPEEITKLAEFQKIVKGGMEKEKIERLLKSVGFSEVTISYRWYIGEGAPAEAGSSCNIGKYLRRCLPVSRNMFKYISVEAVK